MKSRIVSIIACHAAIFFAVSLTAYSQNPEKKDASGGAPSGDAAAAQQQQAAPQQPPADPLLWTKGKYSLKLGIDVGGQYAAESNSWWNLSSTFAPTSGFNPDLGWAEVYFKPGLTGSIALSEKTSLYGGFSIVGSANIDKDVFDQGNSGRVLLENSYFGIKYKKENGFEVDISGGGQPYKIAGGFLISMGGGNGFERGATSLAPRRAWERTAIAKVGYKNLSLTSFYIDPRELSSGNSDTRLAGADLKYSLGGDEYFGVAYVHSPKSGFAYIQAPITFIEEGRKGLHSVQAYGKFRPARVAQPGLLVQGDFAKQWNGRINLDSWAMNADVSNTFTKRKWMPTIGYSFRYYSGDDPDTPELERFDSLYYDGSPNTYSSGANGSFNFYNSNIVAHRVKFGLVFTPSNLFDVFYYHIRAAKENSPLQFGQGYRFNFVDGVPTISTGVPQAHLADDLYFQYTRVLTKNMYLTSGVGFSWPGKGFDLISDGTADTWIGALINLVVVF